ncbi:Zinc ribbon domain protein [Anatilimnocola aggregata]|uniref:Zinc ribbon domain protein n=1 Tax=Anatilimnocola aggregata TaxID=2528021 RepID=A0A517YHH9_9BACT|nr:FmdB family zinc ribbon protein [Anatilimnocola aggregata]QDU29655.1 Zinc ribbon domain protein [Anatilimnocola aggregata]
MPTYDYECDACGHKEEVFQSFSDPLIEKCPKCKKKKFRRLFGAGAAVMFKGTGFYTTDYRSDSYKKAASADSKPAESSGGSSDSSTKSETKPATPAPKSDSSSSGSSGGSSGSTGSGGKPKKN